MGSRLPDFRTLTELPGLLAPAISHDMMMTRYAVARELSEGKDVLELACGTGIGLEFLAKGAKKVVGVDIESRNISRAREIYSQRFELHVGDACSLSFSDQSFDVVLLLEAIYWLKDATAFIREATRILRPHGKLLIVSANPEWIGWTASWAAPYSTKYYSASELFEVLTNAGFTVQLKAGFKDVPTGLSTKMMTTIRKLAFDIGFIPSTLKGREKIKKWVYRDMKPFPIRVEEGSGVVRSLTEVDPSFDTSDFRIIYAIGSLE